MTFLSRDGWNRFRDRVTNSDRYIFGSSLLKPSTTPLRDPSAEEFLDELLRLSSSRTLRLDKGTVLWRAQLGGSQYTPRPDTWVNEDGSEARLEGFSHRAFLKPHGCERMTPWSNKAKEGRVNPKGIPYLYAATAQQTALSEAKPIAGSYLTLASFVTVRELRIVDFATPRTELLESENGPTEGEMDKMAWEDINDLFSEPVTDSDDTADYAPTQIVAELLRRTGYDGVRYKSKINEFKSLEPLGSAERPRESEPERAQPGDDIGRNVALFDLTSATFQDPASLYKFAIDASGAFAFQPVKAMVFCSHQIPEMG